MKKLYILLLCCAAAFGAQARGTDKIDIRDVNITTDTETVAVSFTAPIDRKAAPRDVTVVYAPVITDGQYKVSLPAIVVQSGRAAMNWARREWAADTQAVYENAIYTQNGRTVNYTATVAFQPWMHDSRIELETVTAGCCNAATEKSLLIAGILPAPAPVIEPEPEIIVVEREPTVVEFLQGAFSFVLPASEFDPAEPFRFYDDERDNSLTIYYKLNNYDIDKDYADNARTLINLIAAIDLIRESGEADVSRVVVAGFSSPEGPLDVNDRLAWERAVSVKEYIIRNTYLRDEEVMLFNGSADWRGLRRSIAADRFVPGQSEALAIIDDNPVWDAQSQTRRLALLRNLRGGETYRYVAETIFPKLRNGAFIRVYFETK